MNRRKDQAAPDHVVSSAAPNSADGYGSAVPDLLFTSEASTASMNPSTLASSRKFELVTALPDCDLVWLTSTASQNRSALVSPISTAIGMPTSPVLPPPLTPRRFTMSV